MGTCVFCEIVAGARAAHIVGETSRVVAFMDQFRQPRDPGHVLVIPREHIENIYGVDDALGGELFAVQSRIARAIRSAFEPDGLSTWSSNGPGANQEVPHFHLHVYPRRLGVPFPPPITQPEQAVPDATLAPAAARIRDALRGVAAR